MKKNCKDYDFPEIFRSPALQYQGSWRSPMISKFGQPELNFGRSVLNHLAQVGIKAKIRWREEESDFLLEFQKRKDIYSQNWEFNY